MPSANQHLAVLHQPIDDGLHVGAVIADEDDHRALRAGDILQRIGLAVGCRQPEIGAGVPSTVDAAVAAMVLDSSCVVPAMTVSTHSHECQGR